MNENPEISEFLRSRIEAGDFPSAVYLVGEKGNIRFIGAVGDAVVEPERIRATRDTIYDLASLTKILVTTLIAARLIEEGRLSLNDRITKFFAEFDGDDKRQITVANLLAHDSGFRGWLPFYLLTDARSGIVARIAAEPLFNPIGTKVVYSDLNFLLLTFIIESICGRLIDDAAREMIFEPLGLKSTFFNPPEELRKRIAASERGNEFEKNTCIDLGYEIPEHSEFFRKDVIWGEVHDGNCYFMGGVSGHAGLFSTAVETFAIARQFLASETVLLEPGTCSLFTSNLTPELNEARSAGFQLAATPESTASHALAPESYGHLGFTGTSVWIDPRAERIFILLTNRTHAHELPFILLNSVRRRFHEMAVEALQKSGS